MNVISKTPFADFWWRPVPLLLFVYIVLCDWEKKRLVGKWKPLVMIWTRYRFYKIAYFSLLKIIIAETAWNLCNGVSIVMSRE